MSLIALGAMLFVSGPLAAQTQHMSKTTGPAGYAWMFGETNVWPFYDSFSGSLSLSTSGTLRNPSYILNYTMHSTACDLITGDCVFQDGYFQGPIPQSSVSHSGRTSLNGAYQVGLNVDTSTIDAGGAVQKTGNGGLIQLTLTQDPEVGVYTLTGESTWEDLSGKQKQTGSEFSVDAKVSSAYIWMNPVEFSAMDTYSNIQWLQLTNIK